MFPFSSKPTPNYVAPKIGLTEKALDTSASEAHASLNGGLMLPIMPDPKVDWFDAQKYKEIADAVSICPVAQRCVDIRADKLSSVKVSVEGGWRGAELLASPNARDKSLAQNIYIWTNDLTLVGELWLMLDMSITGRDQLWRARPDLLVRDFKARTITYDDGRLTGQSKPRFRFHFDENWDCISCEEWKGGRWLPYNAYLIRIAHHNPTSDAAGQGSVRSVLRSIRAWLDLESLIATNIKRGGPKHAATVKGTTGLSDTAWATLNARLRAAASASQSGTAILPDATLVATGSSFSELSAPEIKESLERSIATGLAVQPVLLGMKDENDYAALRGAERIFYKTWVKPEAEWLFEQLEAALRIHLKEPALTISLDEAHLSFTEDDNMERAKTMKDLGVFSINEIRAVMGAASVPGGETVAGTTNGNSGPSPAAGREVDRALGTQSDAERAVDQATKPREVALNADTDMRKPVEPSEKPNQ